MATLESFKAENGKCKQPVLTHEVNKNIIIKYKMQPDPLPHSCLAAAGTTVTAMAVDALVHRIKNVK